MIGPLEDEAALAVLREFVSSEGWRLFAAYARAEWGAHQILERLVADPEVVRKELAARAAIERLMAYPLETIARLEAKADAPPAPLIARRA